MKSRIQMALSASKGRRLAPPAKLEPSAASRKSAPVERRSPDPNVGQRLDLTG